MHEITWMNIQQIMFREKNYPHDYILYDYIYITFSNDQIIEINWQSPVVSIVGYSYKRAKSGI